MKILNFFSLILTMFVLAGGGGGSAQPRPGATFSGPIQIDAARAESATLTFTVSDDGTAITKVGISYQFQMRGHVRRSDEPEQLKSS